MLYTVAVLIHLGRQSIKSKYLILKIFTYRFINIKILSTHRKAIHYIGVHCDKRKVQPVTFHVTVYVH